MSSSELFSDGVDNLLQAVRPHGRATTAFPPAFDEANARRRPGETLHAWFVRVVDAYFRGEPMRAAIEDEIGVFVHLSWQERTSRLTYANVQTLVAASDLDTYYLDGGDARYFRLDFDYRTLGEPFSHPLAHIHVDGESAPRFALDGGNAGNIVVDYLEFLYRNFAPQKWVAWAEREWQQEFTRTALPDESNPFPTIRDAFLTNDFEVLRQHSTTVRRIKRLLRERKDTSFAHHMDGADRELLEYPGAR